MSVIKPPIPSKPAGAIVYENFVSTKIRNDSQEQQKDWTESGEWSEDCLEWISLDKIESHAQYFDAKRLRLRNHVIGNEPLWPIYLCYFDDEDYYAVGDGTHRVELFKQMQHTHILAVVERTRKYPPPSK